MPNVPRSAAASAQVVPSSLRRGVGERADPQEERALVRMAQNGTAAAYEELVRRNQQRVFAIIGGILRRREDIEDVAQQVFIKAYSSLKRFDLRSAFSTWLYKISVNECWDYLRKKRARPLVYEADMSEEQVQRLASFATPERAPTGPDERALLRELVDRLLDQLTLEDRQILWLKEVEGFSVEEVGQMLDLNVNTVKVRLFRARGRLMKCYRQRLGGASRRATEGQKG